MLADRIVDKFGEDTFRIIEEEPERLAELEKTLKQYENITAEKLWTLVLSLKKKRICVML